MDLEEIKEELNKDYPFCDGWCAPDECLCVSQDMLGSVRWLISEVERLQALAGYAEGYSKAQEFTAKRCIEIADNNSCECIDNNGKNICCGIDAIQAIRKEFNL